MKRIFLPIIFVFTCFFFISCTSKGQNDLFDKDRITQIELLVADSSIFDNNNIEEQKGRLLYMYDGLGFVDSSGKPLHKPLQRILFKGAEKDKLLDILFAYFSKNTGEQLTACAPMYRHAFLFYSDSDKPVDQIHLCLQCSIFNFLTNKKRVELIQEDKHLYGQLIELLREKGVYLYLMIPPPPGN